MTVKARYLTKNIREDLKEKMVFLGGPRQVGKTTLARDIIARNYKSSYYNNGKHG
jgi:predicted AAA+ superfamily ATPase